MIFIHIILIKQSPINGLVDLLPPAAPPIKTSFLLPVLNEVLTFTGRKSALKHQKRYSLIDSFEILNEYIIFNYTAKTFDIFKKNAGSNSNKTKLSFTDSSIILTMQESDITDLVSFDQQFENFTEINLIGLDYL